MDEGGWARTMCADFALCRIENEHKTSNAELAHATMSLFLRVWSLQNKGMLELGQDARHDARRVPAV
jgi:hypothetical protein